jgi:GT2 family glycosyltransferase
MNHGKPIDREHPHVAIIILNWKSWEDTIECLESLYQITYPNYSVIVVDNGSENESIKKIKDYAKGEIKVRSKYVKFNPKNKPIQTFEITNKRSEDISNKHDLNKIEKKIINYKPPKKLVLIKNDKNYGFAKGNNIGIKFALNALNPEYILLLNNDTAVEPDFLTKMVTAGARNKHAGIIGPRIPYYDRPDRNWFCKGIINWFSINIAYHGEKCEGRNTSNDYITGCAALIKKEVIKKIGFLNEKLFLYFEDAEYSLRVKDKGYELLVEPEAVVYHKVSATSYTFVLSKAQYYFSRNRLWFVKKYCPKKYLRLSLMFIFLRLFLATGFFALKGEQKTVTAIFEAYKEGYNTSL